MSKAANRTALRPGLQRLLLFNQMVEKLRKGPSWFCLSRRSLLLQNFNALPRRRATPLVPGLAKSATGLRVLRPKNCLVVAIPKAAKRLAPKKSTPYFASYSSVTKLSEKSKIPNI